MNKILKYEIQSDIRDIQAEIDYEEYMFNKVFKSDVTFKKSYEKFNLIYNVYGSHAYRKFVPSCYQKQDIVNLVNNENYLILLDRHGKKIYNNLVYTVTRKNYFAYHSKAKGVLYTLVNMFTRKQLKFKNEYQLMLPESIPEIHV